MHHEPVRSVTEAAVNGPHLTVELPAGITVTLTLRLRLHAYPPSYRWPWERKPRPG
ncbi:hypothetical protein [Nonomuraea helvata]|uniref:Alpha-L-rhamnosidase C-terminal domain-containing protein n=1 Tax=Nonomuraea helvata TaxID=37484 RepID=A0ABV5SCC4_9ACTN